MIDNSLDNLIDYINDYEEENDTLLTMIDDIFSRTEKVTEDTKYNSTLERFIYFFDDMVDRFRLANKYLYFSQNIHSPLMNLMPGHYVEDEGECDSDYEEDDDKDQDDSEEIMEVEPDESGEIDLLEKAKELEKAHKKEKAAKADKIMDKLLFSKKKDGRRASVSIAQPQISLQQMEQMAKGNF